MVEKRLRFIVLGSILAAVALGLLNVWLSDLNQDEGWYLYASRLIARGELPYRDFAFTQPPLMPFVYLGALPFVELWGLLGGRLFTMLLGLAGAGVAAWAAGRIAPAEKRETALAAFILIAVNCYQSHFTAVVKTYALAALLLSAGILFLTWKGSHHGLLSSVLAGVFLALAAGTRISLAVLLPIVLVWLLLQSRRGGAGREWIGFLVGATSTMAILFLPFILGAADNFIFFNFAYHSARDVGGLLPQLIYKAGFLSRWAAGYTIAFLIALALLLARLADRKPARRRPRIDHAQGFGTALLWVCAAAVTLVHLSAPFPYDDYQVAVFPLFAMALAVGGVRLAFNAVRSRTLLRYCLWGLLLVSLISSFSSPINQDWFVSGRNLIWWRLKSAPDIVKLRRAGDWLRRESGRTTRLLSQDVYLAVESGLEIPSELAMGPFSYYPELSTEAARRLNVCNREILERLLSEYDAKVAALSGYSFAIAAPAITAVDEAESAHFREIVRARFDEGGEIGEFGQAHTRLELYRDW